jgi:hypothetical protein
MAWILELSLEDQFMQSIRQGDVILLSVAQIVSTVAPPEVGFPPLSGSVNNRSYGEFFCSKH